MGIKKTLLSVLAAASLGACAMGEPHLDKAPGIEPADEMQVPSTPIAADGEYYVPFTITTTCTADDPLVFQDYGRLDIVDEPDNKISMTPLTYMGSVSGYRNLTLSATGSFAHEGNPIPVAFDGFILFYLKADIKGNVDGRVLTYEQNLSVGWVDGDNNWVPECVESFRSGLAWQRHMRYHGGAVTSVDGQWKALEDVTFSTGADWSDYQGVAKTVRILTRQDEHRLKIRGADPPLNNLLRAADGTVDYSLLSSFQDKTLTGEIQLDSLNLYGTWTWKDIFSGLPQCSLSTDMDGDGILNWDEPQTSRDSNNDGIDDCGLIGHWERTWIGTRRFEEHVDSPHAPFHGSYKAAMTLTEDTFTDYGEGEFVPFTEYWEVEIVPAIDGEYVIEAGGIRTRVTPDDDGTFNVDFTRESSLRREFSLHGYIDGNRIVSLDMMISMYNRQTDEFLGHGRYEGQGKKRLMNAHTLVLREDTTAGTHQQKLPHIIDQFLNKPQVNTYGVSTLLEAAPLNNQSFPQTLSGKLDKPLTDGTVIVAHPRYDPLLDDSTIPSKIDRK